MPRKMIILPALLLFVLSLVQAQDYYADVEISVDERGLVSIFGTTNHPSLDVTDDPAFTHKRGRYWLLNISLEDRFSDFIYVLQLPRGATINYLKTPGFARIEQADEGLRVVGTGKEQQFVIIVQYEIIEDGSQEKHDLFFLLTASILAAAIGLIFYLLYRKYRKKAKPRAYNYSLLTERQRKILNMLEKARKPMTQAEIEKLTGMPKSSLSRNVDALVRRGIIKKEQKGMSNIIFLNDDEQK